MSNLPRLHAVAPEHHGEHRGWIVIAAAAIVVESGAWAQIRRPFVPPAPRASGTVNDAGDSIATPPAAVHPADGRSTMSAEEIGAARSVLLNLDPEVGPAARQAAAMTLWNCTAVEATAALAQAIRSGRAEVLSPVLDLIVSATDPRLNLVQPVLDAALDPPPAMAPSLNAALASFGQDGLAAAARVALMTGSPSGHRLRAIQCLGGFASHNPACVSHLMTLLDAARNEPQPILEAACDSLGSITQLPWGREPSTWRDWWASARSTSPETWGPQALRTINTRLSDLSARHDQLARRYVNALRDLFVRLPLDQQLAALGPLIEDDTVLVREFALDRVARLLRDSERVPPDIQSLLVRRLDAEPTGRLRLQVATLLNELNDENLADWLRRAIESETRPVLLAGLFHLLADRHEHVPIDVIARWLGDEAVCDGAATAAWVMYRDQAISDIDLTTLRNVVADSFSDSSSPALVRLMAVICDDARMTDVESLLSPEHGEATRRAAAEGLRVRGRIDPLIARAGDPVILAQAVEALADGEPSLNSFTTLAQLEPDDPELRQLWTGAIVNLAHRLPISALLAADNILETRQVEPAVRSQALAHAVDASDSHDGEMGVVGELLPAALVARAVELRLGLDDANGALEVLDAHASPEDPTLSQFRFDTLLLLGRYDDALAVHQEPVAWIAAMDRVTVRRPDLLAPLREEILTRFQKSLTDDQRSALRQASAEGRGAASAGSPLGAGQPG